MSHTFKYNKTKGTYEVLKGKAIVKECRTMQEATTFIAEKDGVANAAPKLTVVKNKKEIGFGTWGVPTFMLKATGGLYEVDNGKQDK